MWGEKKLKRFEWVGQRELTRMEQQLDGRRLKGKDRCWHKRRVIFYFKYIVFFPRSDVTDGRGGLSLLFLYRGEEERCWLLYRSNSGDSGTQSQHDEPFKSVHVSIGPALYTFPFAIAKSTTDNNTHTHTYIDNTHGAEGPVHFAVVVVALSLSSRTVWGGAHHSEQRERVEWKRKKKKRPSHRQHTLPHYSRRVVVSSLSLSLFFFHQPSPPLFVLFFFFFF